MAGNTQDRGKRHLLDSSEGGEGGEGAKLSARVTELLRSDVCYTCGGSDHFVLVLKCTKNH